MLLNTNATRRHVVRSTFIVVREKNKNKNKCEFIACFYFVFVPAALNNLQTYIKSAVSAVIGVAYGKAVYGGAEELL